MRKVEVTGVHQKTLENLYHTQIHECNQRISILQRQLENWDSVNSRIKARYTKEEYKKEFLDYQYSIRRDYIQKLRDVRNGYMYE